MADKTRAQLVADIAAYLADNNVGAITPAILRQRLADLAETAGGRYPTFSLGPTGANAFRIEYPWTQIPFDAATWGSSTGATGHTWRFYGLAAEVEIGPTAANNAWSSITSRQSSGYHLQLQPGTNGSYATFGTPFAFWVTVMVQNSAPGLISEVWWGIPDDNTGNGPSTSDAVGLRVDDRGMYGLICNGATGVIHVSDRFAWDNSGIPYPVLVANRPGVGIWFEAPKARNADYTSLGYGDALTNGGTWLTRATTGELVTSASQCTRFRVRVACTAGAPASGSWKRGFSNLRWASGHSEQDLHPCPC